MGIHEKLLDIQLELKAPKAQFNEFGGYPYRNAEDILEALKPLLKKTQTTLVCNHEIVNIGTRYYVKATARLTDIKTGESLETVAYAREEETRKGMDSSQITGASSSYARKYALNCLFCIDDTKDADFLAGNNNFNQIAASGKKATQKQVDILKKSYKGDQLAKLLQANKIEKIEDISFKKASELVGIIINKRINV